jgi:hypothetical protein
MVMLATDEVKELHASAAAKTVRIPGQKKRVAGIVWDTTAKAAGPADSADSSGKAPAAKRMKRTPPAAPPVPNIGSAAGSSTGSVSTVGAGAGDTPAADVAAHTWQAGSVQELDAALSMAPSLLFSLEDLSAAAATVQTVNNSSSNSSSSSALLGVSPFQQQQQQQQQYEQQQYEQQQQQQQQQQYEDPAAAAAEAARAAAVTTALENILSKSNLLSQEDVERIREFFQGRNPTPDKAQVKFKLHEENVTDSSTGETKRETLYVHLDYGTMQWRKTKKVKAVAA